jgi:hypothetical protein
VSSNRPPSGPFFAKGSADLVLSSQAKAFMHKNPFKPSFLVL